MAKLFTARIYAIESHRYSDSPSTVRFHLTIVGDNGAPDEPLTSSERLDSLAYYLHDKSIGKWGEIDVLNSIDLKATVAPERRDYIRPLSQSEFERFNQALSSSLLMRDQRPRSRPTRGPTDPPY